MMNFLDLSSASDEERRLISEILSDTSVVNFVQPARQHPQEHSQEELTHVHQNSLPQYPHYNQHTNQSHHQTIIKSKIPHNHAYQSAQSHHQHHPHSQLHQNHTPNTNSTNQRLNHVHNSNNNPVTAENHHHANHVQMPPPLAGDMNPNVVGMDMTAPQHASYPIAPSAHVPPGYGPPPPPHMYGGHPIFQASYQLIPFAYPPNMIYGNTLPYASVLPATNSVVTPRQQQVPPQTNQPPNSTVANISHSRSHSHHPRQMKIKDQANKQGMMHQNHHQSTSNHQPVQSHSFKPTQQNTDTSIKSSEKTNERPNNDYEPVIDNHQFHRNDFEQHKSDSDGKSSKQDNAIKMSTTEQNSEDINNVINNVSDRVKGSKRSDETVKISSDEGFDTQSSSIDVSKQSQGWSATPSVDKSDKSNNDMASVETPRSQSESNVTESVNIDRLTIQDNDEKTNQSAAWGSSSKSWASLFKGTGPAPNGEVEPNSLDTTNSDEDNIKSTQRKSDGNSQSSSKGISSKDKRSQDAARRALDKMAPRLASKLDAITLKHSLPLLRPRGFINKGNGCYINSTLQALIACPPFYNLMKEIGDLKCLRRENSCTPILDSFAELFLNFPPLDSGKKNKQFAPSDQKMQINYLQAEAIEPKCIYDALGQIKFECLKGAQEDAEEFLSSVLNGLHEEMIGLSEILQSNQNNSSSQNGHQSDVDEINGDVNNDENLWREVGPKNRSIPIRAATVINTPIQEIFGGSLFSIRTAGKDRCGNRSPFFTLQLDISGDNVKTLQDAIKSFTAPEIIQDFYCSKTKQKVDAHCRTSLDHLPPILILHLKQFVWQDQGLKKLMKRIEFPIDFELPDDCLSDKNSDKSPRTSRSYILLAVVYHEGKEAVKGHYLTDVYHIGSSQWIRCDDSNLKAVPSPRIDNPEHSSRTPYLLFYRRLNTLKPPQSNNNSNNNVSNSQQQQQQQDNNKQNKKVHSSNNNNTNKTR